MNTSSQKKTGKAQQDGIARGGRSKSTKKVAAVKKNGSSARDREQERLKKGGKDGSLNVDKIVCGVCNVYELFHEVKHDQQKDNYRVPRSTISLPLKMNAKYPLGHNSKGFAINYRCGYEMCSKKGKAHAKFIMGNESFRKSK